MHSNNDFMPPDWRPDPPKTPELVKQFEVLYWFAVHCLEKFRNVPDEGLKETVYSIHVSGDRILELRKILKEKV